MDAAVGGEGTVHVGVGGGVGELSPEHKHHSNIMSSNTWSASKLQIHQNS